MKENNTEISILIAQAKNTIEITLLNRNFYNNFKQKEFKTLEKTTVSAMVLSQIITDFYTCVETYLFRVSQVFENNLRKEKWHKELLYKMALDIPNIRIAAISKQTMLLLDEILRFRHFRRYYFNFDYDWEKLEMIEKKYINVYDILNSDIQNFIDFLEKLISKEA